KCPVNWRAARQVATMKSAGSDQIENTNWPRPDHDGGQINGYVHRWALAQKYPCPALMSRDQNSVCKNRYAPVCAWRIGRWKSSDWLYPDKYAHVRVHRR